MGRRGTATILAVLGVAVAVAGCGGSDRPRPTAEDGVRAAARVYLGALAARDWTRACTLMTPAARRDLFAEASAPCPRALAAGGTDAGEELASARREVAGADVEIRGAAASIGPLGTAQQPLRLQRVAGRWLVTG